MTQIRGFSTDRIQHLERPDKLARRVQLDLDAALTESFNSSGESLRSSSCSGTVFDPGSNQSQFIGILSVHLGLVGGQRSSDRTCSSS